MTRRRQILAGMAAASMPSLSLLPGAARAQAYPSRPIRYVIPFPPGGVGDVLGRLIAQKLSENLGQPVVVDNRAGGNTVIGADLVAKASPDGYTILQAIDNTLTMNQSLYTRLSYDPIKDFVPISLVARVATVLVANNNFPASNVRDLVALARTKPDHYPYGSASLTMYLGGALLNKMAGIKLTPVMYKGGTASVTDVIAGHIPVSFEGMGTVLQFWKQGRLKILGAMGATRLAVAPDIQTIAEQGVEGYDVSAWQCLVAPAGTPAPVVARLNAEVAKIMKLPDVVERLKALSVEPMTSSPEELGQFIRSESAKWGAVIKEIGFKIE